ncbi:MAG: hypothetical protein ACHQF0_05445 [Chitinophagales bacterium]
MSLSGCFLLQLYVEITEIKNFYPQGFVNGDGFNNPIDLHLPEENQGFFFQFTFMLFQSEKSVVIFAALSSAEALVEADKFQLCSIKE